MINYAFLVVTYNSADTIIDMLESIKYQIENYSNGYQIQLVICDDASKDGTPDVVNGWLEINNNLFAKINCNYNKQNVGTCKNIVKGFRQIECDKFRDLGGDDILPRNNCFEQMDMLDEYDVVRGYTVAFARGKIKRAYDDNFLRIARKFDTRKSLKFKTYYDCPFNNGTMYKKSLLTNKVLDYIEQYNLVEDRPMWFRIVRDNPKLRIGFSEEPTLLYREEGKGVTSNESPHRSIVNEDYYNIYRNIMTEVRNPFIKYVIWCQWFANNRFIKFINPITYYKRITKKRYKLKINFEEYTRIFDINQHYMEEIMNRAKDFE